MPDIGGRKIERQAAILQMMSQMRNRNAGRESEMEKLNKEYEDKRRWESEEARKERVANAQIKGSEADIAEGQKRSDLADWRAQREEIYNAAGETRAQAGEVREQAQEGRAVRKFSEIDLPLGHAQIESTRAEIPYKKAQTKYVETQTEGAEINNAADLDKAIQGQNDAIKKHANDTWNMGVQNVQSGNPSALSKENADHLEQAGKIKFGPAFKLPRGPDGSLDPAQIPNLIQTTTDDKGEPSAKFAREVRTAEKPLNNFEGYIRLMSEANARGDKEAAKYYGKKIASEVMPTVGKVQGQLLQQMLDDGDIEGVKATLPGYRQTKMKGVKEALPPAAARQQTEDGINTLGQIGRLNQKFLELKDSMPLPPTGRLTMPIYDFWAFLQMSNPEEQAFRANIKDIVAQYRKFITGKASNETEAADLLQAVPNENDDVGSFAAKLEEMRFKTLRKIRTDLGMQRAYGLKVPVELENDPNFVPISPTDAIKMWGAPDLSTEAGQRMWHAGELDKGQRNLRASGYKIGSLPAEARQKGGDEQIGQSVSPEALQDFYNKLDPKLQPLFEKMSPEDQVAVMEGRK